jgi:drug/metabolite transporter (DMT)-like permease
VARSTQPAESLAPPPAVDALLLLVAVVGVSFSGPLMAATAAPALAIAFWRNAMGGSLAVTVALLRRAAELRRIDRSALAAAGLAGGALAVHFGTWVPSLTMTSVASATALVCSQTVFTALIARLRGRHLPPVAWSGILAATLGAVLITGADFGVSARALAGDLLALAGAVAAAIYVTIGASARQRMSTTSYTAICYATCAALLLVVCLLFGLRLSGYPANAWVKLLLVTGCAQLLGHSLINVVLRSTSATVVSLIILLEVPGAALIAFVWLHQRPPALALPGVGLLLVGLLLVAWVGARAHEKVHVDAEL